jgi:hypothetical protein
MATLECSLCAGLLLLALSGTAQAQSSRLRAMGAALLDDGSYLIANIPLDLQDIATSPLYIASPNSPFRQPRFYLALGAAAALWGGSFALDQTLHGGLRNLSHSDHDIMENFSYTTLLSALGLLYVDGLYTGNDRLRRYLLTGTEAAGMGVLFNLAIKAAFGRLRPAQTSSHLEFFHSPSSFNSRSFTSNDMVIETAMATGLSEYYDNRWYMAAPAYSLVALEGVTRLKNQQWFSDVVAGGLLGWGTAKLLLRLHRQHALEPNRWRLVPIAAPPPAMHSTAIAAPALGLACRW